MERLTLAFNTEYGRKYVIDKGVLFEEAINRLGELEDKLEKGELIDINHEISVTLSLKNC